VGLDVAPLLVHHAAQLALHDLEGAEHGFCQGIVRAVIDLLFFRDQFVAGRNSDIDSYPILVSFFMGVIGLLNSNVAPANVIAEFVQTLGFLQYHLFDAEGFFQATIRDVYWQLHSDSIVTQAGSSRQALSCPFRSGPDWRLLSNSLQTGEMPSS